MRNFKNEADLQKLLFTIFSDDENLNNQQKIFNVLNDNLSRIMSFFGVVKLSKVITVCIHTVLEEWKSFYNSLGGQYEDYVVGCAWECKIDFPKEKLFDFQQFVNFHFPYCAAQKLVRGLVEKVSHKKLLEYACDAEKLYMDWEKIWES